MVGARWFIMGGDSVEYAVLTDYPEGGMLGERVPE